ncbi:hypothetical protein DFH08DRAFT_850351 [Mycena albidolilacea]|uniref:Uncharacterized protein n=1 Tax=Mycena albidolilacea TaxID=1033008 RepID=A0AAD7AEV0_9AGAR|nr:hypothetical protein DFH08DRAFT_850351 [Mycena albidolilacea]
MLQVQELLDLTIDFLHDSRADLKRCATVSKSWLPAAQYHLFSYYVLQNVPDCQRLLNIPPHIRRLVTHLAISLNAWDNDAYTALGNVQLALSNLRKLSIYRFPPNSGLVVMQQLCSLPSITHIFMLRHEDPVRQSSLFMLRTAPLGILEISHRFDDDNYNKKITGSMPSPERRCIVDSIDIHSTDRGRKTLPQSLTRTLDISMLRRLRLSVHDCVDAKYLNQLLQYCTSVSDLEIHGTIGNSLEVLSAAKSLMTPQPVQDPSEGN